MIRFSFMLIVVGLLAGVGYLNQEQVVSLHFFGGMQTHPVPLYWIGLATFLLGLLLGALWVGPGWLRSALARRKQAKRIEQLEIDLDRIRSAALKGGAGAPSKPMPGGRTNEFR